MSFRRILVLLTVFVLAFTLAACGGGNNNGADNNGDSTQPPTQQNGGSSNDGDGDGAQEEEDQVVRTPEMEFDLGGRVIKFVSWWDMGGAFTGDNPDNIAMGENLEALKQKHNFDVEFIFIDFGEYQERVVASLMAGEPLGDVVRMGRKYMIPTLVKQDMFWPVDEYIVNEKVFNMQATEVYSQFEGRGYGFSEQKNLSTGIFYNRTLMNNLGLKPLQDYVDEGTWTWDTFIEVAKSANRDTNNDGRIDTWGLASDGLLNQAMGSNNTDLYVDDRENLEDPKLLEVFNFLSRLAVEEVARPTEGGDWREPREFFVQGNTLMYAGADYETNGLKNDMAEYDVGFVPFPKGPSATTYHATEPDVQFLTIPRAIPDPDKLIYIWEKIHDIDSIYDYKGQADYESMFDNEDDIRNVKLAADNMNITSNNAFPSMPYYNIQGDLLEGVSVSTVVETYKAQVQAAIDEVYHDN